MRWVRKGAQVAEEVNRFEKVGLALLAVVAQQEAEAGRERDLGASVVPKADQLDGFEVHERVKPASA